MLEQEEKSYIKKQFGVSGIGKFELEIYHQNGDLEALIHNPDRRPAPELFLEDFPELAQEARKNPADGDIYWNLGMALKDTKEYHAALQSFERADALIPNDPAILAETAILKSYYLGRTAEAVQTCRRAIALPNPPANAYFCLIKTLCMLHRFDEARAAVVEAISKFPSDAGFQEAQRRLANS